MSPADSTSDERIETLHRKAAHLHHDHRFAEEAEVWRELCKIDPTNPYWLHNLALALLHSAQLDECVPLFYRLLKEAPNLSRVHNNFAMASLRLGMPPKFVYPHFIQALELSDDQSEFYRHLMNSCNSIVYGFDDHTEAEAALDVLADCVARLMQERSEPKHRRKNVEYLGCLVDVYRHVARFRSFFAHTEWTAAERELALIRHELGEMGLSNFVQGLARIQTTFELARDISAYLENVANGLYKDPDAALTVCTMLHNRTYHDRSKHDEYFHFAKVHNILGSFLAGMAVALRYLGGEDRQLSEIADRRREIQLICVDYFSDLGQDLLTTLRAMERICLTIATITIRRANVDLASDERHAGWQKVCLLFNGLHLDFRAVDVALARGCLGWVYDPRQECIRAVQGFKAFIERQAWQDIYVNGSPQENIARGLLQAYLIPRSYREISVRGGRSDVLMFKQDKRFLFEMKIWRGPSYFHAGLSEIREYIDGEGDDHRLACSFYIIFDPTVTQRANAYLALENWSALPRKENIEVVVLNIKPPRPSAAVDGRGRVGARRRHPQSSCC